MIDELVFKKAQKGDWESFYELVEPIKGKLYRSAFIYFKNENDAMDTLDVISETEKDLIVKRYIDDMKISDISKVSNIPVGTVKSRLNRTLKKLRVILGGV